MSPLVLAALAALAVGLTIRSARRGHDRSALAAHHRALETLAEMNHLRSGPPVGEAQVVPAAPAPAPSRNRPRQARGAGPPEDVGQRYLAPPMPAAALVAQTVGAGGTVRRRPPAHRRRAVPTRFIAGVAAVTVTALAVAVVLAVVVGRHPAKPSSPKQPVPAAAGSTPVRSTPTSLAAPVVLVATDSQQARFRVAQAGANIELVTLSSCWVQIRSGSATGPVIFSATLHRGDRHPVPAAQAVWVRVGNPPGMSVEVNGTPLPIAAPSSSQPFNVIFEPAP